MGDLNLIVFNVDHGLCVLVRTPSGHFMMIDAGCSASFKPAEWVANQTQLAATWHGRHKLTQLIVTHPHDDHVEGINSVIEKLPPAFLLRRKDLPWHEVLNPPDGDPSENAKEFYEWQHSYNSPVVSEPDYGCSVTAFSLSKPELDVLPGQLQNCLNNSSYVTVITWNNGEYTWKAVICGDNEEAGLNALMAKPGFVEAISDCTILVTPHHGHSSGYCGEFVEALGKPQFVFHSVPKKCDHLDVRYDDLSSGFEFGGNTRRVLTTRHDGHIWIRSYSNHYEFVQLQDLNPLLEFMLSLNK